MKILIFANQLYLGGAERVASLIANGLSKRHYDIVFAADIENYPITYSLDKDIKIVNISHDSKEGIIFMVRRIISRIIKRRIIIKNEDPDVIIAFTHQVYFWTMLANCFIGKPLIASDHTSMDRDMGFFSNLIRKYFYKYADVLTILTNKDKKLLGNKFPNKVVVPNPLTYMNILKEGDRKKIILCVGRVSDWYVKGFDRIISIWGKISPLYPDWILQIAGPGDEKSFNYLKELIEKYNVSKTTIFLGQVNDMQPLYQEAGIFALPSRVEGFPMVLMEAMSQGCPCISFSMGEAVSEIVDNGVDAVVIKDDDIDGFKSSLEKLLKEEFQRTFLSENAPVNISRFSLDKVLDLWEIIINKLNHESSNNHLSKYK